MSKDYLMSVVKQPGTYEGLFADAVQRSDTLTSVGDSAVVTHIYSRFSASNTVVDIQVNGTSMGTRDVDGMERITRQTVGGRSWFATYDKSCGSLTAPETVSSPYGALVQYDYEPALGGKLLSKNAGQDEATFTYNLKGAVETATTTIRSTPRSSALITNSYDAVGRLLHETFSQYKGTTAYDYTTAGKLKIYTDLQGFHWEVSQYDQYGRPTEFFDSYVSLTLSYDVLGRIDSWSAAAFFGGDAALTTTLTWDSLDREKTRRVENNMDQPGWQLEQEYYLNHQVSKKTMKRGTGTTLNVVRTENYTYDARNRLTDYACTGSEPTRDDKGNAIAHQYFAYDSYNNIAKAVTAFSSGDPDTAIFAYDNPQDPCQLTSVAHSRSDFPSEAYTYDDAGCLNADASGRQFFYDKGINCGYLRSVQQEDAISTFTYDPLNRVISEGDASFVYRGSTLVCQRQGNDLVRFAGGGSVGTIAQVHDKVDSTGPIGSYVWLSGSDANGSILSVDCTTHYDMAYGPYGETPSDQSTPSVLGYNGQRRSKLLDGYQLGNGDRLYQPAARRFTAPDTLSPFGAGGINPYAYCAGDPINSARGRPSRRET